MLGRLAALAQGEERLGVGITRHQFFDAEGALRGG